MSTDRPVEIRLGVYATDEEVTRLVQGCARLLSGQAVPHQLSVAGAGQPTESGAPSLAEYYDDLPEQWRLGHPGADPGSRAVHEIRVRLSAPGSPVDRVRAELTRLLCPEPDHHSPCPVPWAIS